MTVILHDITPRVQTEARLRASLREKEILLQEIHHRVKNNLQIIASLLRLQAHTVADAALRDLLRDSQHRIHSIALVHEQLYRAHDLAHIDFAAYIRSLATNILRSYATQASGLRLALTIDDHASLDINTAIPLGLIATELINNSIKHAFPNQRAGCISIELHTDVAGLLLIVSDDGVGVTEDLSLRAIDSLGLQLVGDLALQLGGTVALLRGGGTTFQIRIPRPANEEHADAASHIDPDRRG
jgi:two-component sensor histidine kinase